MRQKKAVFSGACFALLMLAIAWADALLTGVTIVDVANGALTPGQTALIEGTRIAAIGTNLSAAEAVPRFDGDNGFLMPGLWDSHVHVFSTPTDPATALPLSLINRVTGIRDMGALWPIAEQQAQQARIEAGEVLGPRLILSGAWVDAAPGSWPGMFLADPPGEARAVVAQIAAEGRAAVKSYSMLNEQAYLALAEAAADAGPPLVGRIPERVALGTALAAGQAGMEHFGRVPMACSTEEGAMLDDLRAANSDGADQAAVFGIMAARNRIVLQTRDATLCAEVLARMAEADFRVTPHWSWPISTPETGPPPMRPACAWSGGSRLLR